MKDIVLSRINSLKMSFKEENRAKEGFEILLHLSNVDNTRLKELLRNHVEKKIYKDDEIYKRNNIDFALAFISILVIAYRISYIPLSEIENVFSKELELLKNKHVKKYYSEYYKLPILIWYNSSHKHHSYTDKLCSAITAKHFERFLFLLRSRMDNNQIDQFLWLLDNGKTFDKEINENFDIDKFWKTIENINKGKDEYFTKIFKISFIGLSDFIEHLENLNSLLNTCKKDKILCSLFWNFESYWLQNLKEEINKNIINKVQTFYINEMNNTKYNVTVDSNIKNTIGNINSLLDFKYRDAFMII